MHSVHDVEPTMEEKAPAKQDVHVVLPNTVLYVPMEHVLQSEMDVSEELVAYVPAEHFMQVELFIAP